MVIPPDSVKEMIAVSSIKLPLQNTVKLFTDVVGKPVGATNQPLAKVTVTLSIYVPVFCMLVLRYINVVSGTVDEGGAGKLIPGL